MKTLTGFCAALLLILPLTSNAQVNSGSDGHDGALNPTANLVINMADHPDGIYHYTSVDIPGGVTVSFIPNASNTPVVWLVQGNCNISGTVTLNGQTCTTSTGASGGPGGFRGGNKNATAGAGLGPGGGPVTDPNKYSGNASYGTIGDADLNQQNGPGPTYGNQFLIPLIGGSGGGGPGGGAGGAILIVTSGSLTVNGIVSAWGGHGFQTYNSGYGVYGGGGGGSGGAIRLVGTSVTGGGSLNAVGGSGLSGWYGGYGGRSAGMGRIRIDALSDTFGAQLSGVSSRGFQPIIFPPPNQSVGLAINSVAGVAVTPTPTGNLTSPDVIVPAAQQNPVSIVVGCTNIPLGTEIIVDVKPANGPTVRAVGLNNAGTQANSTATVQVAMPRGGGTIQAKAVSGIQLAANDDPNAERHSIAKTGWTADGERFKAVEVTAGLGAASQLVYLTESGKRYPMASR